MDKKIIVLSGINLIDGGALSVYYDCMNYMIQLGYTKKYRVLALVGDSKLFSDYADEFEIIEFKWSKKFWIARLFYEYIYFHFFSKKMKVNIWLSMHDITPNVCAEKIYVYCHNPSPFNDMKLSQAIYGWKYYLFSKFYKFLYQININKATAVIVQQDWMRKEFEKMYGINGVIVARPSIPKNDVIDNVESSEIIFVYPSYPRYYKNFEVVCKAADILRKNNINNYKLFITVNGNENIYSKQLYKKYRDNGNIEFCGLLGRKDLYKLYSKTTCLIFMSKLETWGMPLIEFKETGKSIIASDLAYAHESIGDYSCVVFINPDNAEGLAAEMKKVIEVGSVKGANISKVPKQPFACNWKDLFQMIIDP